ncbi:MAG: metalloregulator ArsR/SmtB family transcription factor [Gammaproteobacteria bacterium]|nr:metalloregulator ArsR/SmtB family transcription factor [Gammaproteobacteria bacterium]
MPQTALSSPTTTDIPDLEKLRATADTASQLLKTLSNPDRLLLLCQLAQGERNVSELEALVGIQQPTLSQQLGVLRREGLVETRRDGKQIFYRISSPQALAVINTLYQLFCADSPA